MRAEAGALRRPPRVHQPAPQALPRDLLRLEAMGAHEAVAIARLAAADIDLMDHRIAIEGMMAAQRLVHLVFGVAQIDPVDVRRNRALDHWQFSHVHFLVQRRPRSGQIGVVRRLKAGLHRRVARDLHRVSPSAAQNERAPWLWQDAMVSHARRLNLIPVKASRGIRGEYSHHEWETRHEIDPAAH